jgi:phosphate-selective porin
MGFIIRFKMSVAVLIAVLFLFHTEMSQMLATEPSLVATEPPQNENPLKQADAESRLESALGRLIEIHQGLQREIESLRKELGTLKSKRIAAGGSSSSAIPTPSSAKEDKASAEEMSQTTERALSPETPLAEFRERILNVDLGLGNRGEEFFKKPTLFIQTRYSAGKLPGVALNAGYEANFDLNRLEFNMEGRVTDKFGMGFEIQYHPATDGHSEELVNLAYLDYYVNPYTTLRAGQFIRPFGFDIQQSSFERENPERMNAVGYFFPGQRDRGVFLQGNLNFLASKPLQDLTYWVGISNGNNFFDDNNANVNLNFRLRKYYLNKALATGVSAIIGKQPLPPGLRGNSNGNVFGLDLQWQKGRFGLRAEYLAGNMPSTLLSLPFPGDTEFAPAFRPGRSLAGGHVTGVFQITPKDNAYLRYDQMNSDLRTGLPIKAFNFGYFRQVNPNIRLAFDYQVKNHPSFNDDAQNQRFAITLNSEF